MNVRSEQEDHAYKDRLEKYISRMDRDDILAGFVEKAGPFLVEKGKDDLLPGIADHLEKRPSAQAVLSASVRNMMASVKILTGEKGPDLMFHAPVRTQTVVTDQDITIEFGNLNADYTILMFYQGECPLCEDALINLANKYARLKEQNVRVIAISADKTNEGFEKKLAYHQWPDNYCDYTGMAGENFKNYGVLGVPTLFLLDQDGVVLKKTAMVEELVKIIDKKNPVDPG